MLGKRRVRGRIIFLRKEGGVDSWRSLQLGGPVTPRVPFEVTDLCEGRRKGNEGQCWALPKTSFLLVVVASPCSSLLLINNNNASLLFLSFSLIITTSSYYAGVVR